MAIEFGSIENGHFIPSFRAFVHDNGMPGLRITKEDGSFLNLLFSLPGVQELQKQLALAEKMASSFSSSSH